MTRKDKLLPKEYSSELISIANCDLQTAQALVDVWRSGRSIRPENICYHLQQCVEKSLKAGLCHLGVAVPMVHEISALVAKYPKDKNPPYGYALNDLNDFATIKRYREGIEEITIEEVVELMTRTEEVLAWVKQLCN